MITMEQVRNLGNFAQNFRWGMRIVDSQLDGGALVDARCISSTVPKRTGQSTEVTIRGHKVKEPGVYTYEGTITLTFVDNVSRDVLQAIEDWVEQCWETDTGVQADNETVKTSVILDLLDNTNEIAKTWTLIGAFPESFDPIGGDLSEGSSADAAKPTITLSYDRYELS